MLLYVFLLAALLRLLWAQELLSVLAEQPSLSQFTSFLQRYPDLVKQLNENKFTSEKHYNSRTPAPALII